MGAIGPQAAATSMSIATLLCQIIGLVWDMMRLPYSQVVSASRPSAAWLPEGVPFARLSEETDGTNSAAVSVNSCNAAGLVVKR